jgi:hypothetical protein
MLEVNKTVVIHITSFVVSHLQTTQPNLHECPRHGVTLISFTHENLISVGHKLAHLCYLHILKPPVCAMPGVALHRRGGSSCRIRHTNFFPLEVSTTINAHGHILLTFGPHDTWNNKTDTLTSYQSSVSIREFRLPPLSSWEVRSPGL